MEVLVGKNKFAIGAGIAGVPAILIGRNKISAWSVTLSYVDNCDFYKETIDGD